jgi:hypothetical protein
MLPAGPDQLLLPRDPRCSRSREARALLDASFVCGARACVGRPPEALLELLA